MVDLFNNALTQMRSLIQAMPLEGTVAVDATAGNGKDTLFLAQAVGSKGKVYAFDIQKEALANTKTLLDEHSISWYELIHDSHENLHIYSPENVSVVVFNLGYLPGGSSCIITQPQSTLTAVQNALSILKVGGLLTLVIYTGHQGGQEEAAALHEYFAGLPRAYAVLQMSFLNRTNKPPYLIAVQKQREVS